MCVWVEHELLTLVIFGSICSALSQSSIALSKLSIVMYACAPITRSNKRKRCQSLNNKIWSTVSTHSHKVLFLQLSVDCLGVRRAFSQRDIYGLSLTVGEVNGVLIVQLNGFGVAFNCLLIISLHVLFVSLILWPCKCQTQLGLALLRSLTLRASGLLVDAADLFPPFLFLFPLPILEIYV